jgi:maltooligosyltrehalose synthase
MLFKKGANIPITGDGDFEEHICAFARQGIDKSILVIIPKFLTYLTGNGEELPLGKGVWKDSFIVIHDEIVHAKYRNLFTDEVVEVGRRDGKRVLFLDQIFAHFPAALFENKIDL